MTRTSSPFRRPSAWGAALLALICAWPMLLVAPPLVYFDSFAYEDGGRAVMRVLSGLLAGPDAPGEDGGGRDGTAELSYLRSAAWSATLGLLGGLRWGGVALCVLQTAATLLVLSALVPADAPPRTLALCCGLLAAFSGLPWYASYAMPDMLGALVIGYYAFLAGPFAATSRTVRALFGLLAAYAILGHYGHIPLAAGLAAVLLAWAAATRRGGIGTLAAAACAPLLLAGAVNLAAGWAVEALRPPAEAGAAPRASGVTPGRLPVLLARSIEDGPGRLHLARACARDLYESCAFLPLEARTVGDVLWAEGGVLDLGPVQRAVLAAEEARIVRDAALAFPLVQARAFARNAARQLVRVGLGEHFAWPGETADGARAPLDQDVRRADPVLRVADRTIAIATALGAVLLAAGIAAGRMPRALAGPVLLVLAGLLGNAAIYGGLSYPVDRYGGRIAWLVPMLGLLVWTAPGGGAARALAPRPRG